MPKETSTQRKRRLAKAKLKRSQKLANESPEERERRLTQRYKGLHKNKIDNAAQEYALEPMSLLQVKSVASAKEIHNMFSHPNYEVCIKKFITIAPIVVKENIVRKLSYSRTKTLKTCDTYQLALGLHGEIRLALSH